MSSTFNHPEANNQQTGAKQSGDRLLKIILGFAGVSLAIGVLVVFGVLYKAWSPSFGPKVQILVQPNYSQVSTVDASDLEAAVEILNARSRFMGYGAPFQLAGNDQIIAQVPASADVELLAKTVVHVGLVELVDFGVTPVSPGTTIATDFVYASLPQADGEKWHTIMTNQEFDSVYVSQDAMGRDAISFTLTPDGTKLLADFTGKNVGHYLGIVLDKVVLSSPKINMPITDGQGIIQGSFTKQEAQALASYLKDIGPLPLPLIVKDITQIEQ